MSATLDGDMTFVVLEGELMSAVAANAGTAAVTNAVVAICVVEVPVLAVGARGVPVRLGLAMGAYVEAAVDEVNRPRAE